LYFFSKERVLILWSMAATIHKQIKNRVPRINAMSLVDAKRRSSRMFFLYIFSLAFAVFAAWAYGRSTDRVIAETNLETERLKKENLTLRNDLDSEAGKVAGLQKAALDALAEQQRVQKQLSDAQTTLEEQKGKTAQLERESADAKAAQQRVETELANAQRRAEELRKQNLVTESRLEKERFTRGNLSKLLGKRLLPQLVMMGDKLNVTPLLPFGAHGPGMRAMIEYLPETEPRRAAQSIADVLSIAGWKVISFVENKDLWAAPSDGVEIESYTGVKLPSLMTKAEIEAWKEERRSPGYDEAQERRRVAERISRDAANTLAKFLVSNNWSRVRTGLAAPYNPIEPNTVKILVGFKPEPETLSEIEEEFGRRFGFMPGQVDPDAPLPVQRTQARHFTPEQRAVLLDALRADAFGYDGPRLPIEIRCPAENEEACTFAEKIAGVLNERGWPVKGGKIAREKEFPRLLTGIILQQSAGGSAGVHFDLNALMRTLKSVGFEVRSDFDTLGISTDPLRISVGW
jgi:hypothetical protein